MKTNNAAMSSPQFNNDHIVTLRSNPGSLARPRNRSPRCTATSPAFSESKRNRLAIDRVTRSARPSWSINPSTRPPASNITITPKIAAVPKNALTPRPGIETINATHKIRFNTTAEPTPAVAKANPASRPFAPANVINRKPKALLAAEPPGTKLPSDRVDN